MCFLCLCVRFAFVLVVYVLFACCGVSVLCCIVFVCAFFCLLSVRVVVCCFLCFVLFVFWLVVVFVV